MKPLLTILIVLLAACHTAPQKVAFEEKDRVDLYLDEVQHTRLSAYDRTLLIVISGRCGSCTEKTITFIQKLEQQPAYKDYHKILILPDNNAYVADSIKGAQFTTYIDRQGDLDKYGINFAKNTLVEYRKNEVVLKDYLYLNNIDTLAQKYHITL